MKEIKKVTVVGAGTMGRQIALNAAISGFETTLKTSSDAKAAALLKWASEYFAGRIAKGRMTEEETKEAMTHFHLSISYEEALKEADLVIESVPEVTETKKEVFKMIDRYAPEDAIVGTNSSHMVSSAFKDDLKNPGRLLNLHYFNPALVMKLVEVGQGEHTDPSAALSCMAFAEKCGKEPVRLHKEISGMIVSRILRSITNEAMMLVENGYCSFEDVDKACRNGLSHPMGPFQLADFAGLDLRLNQLEEHLHETGEKLPGYDLYKAHVEKGELGKKSGKGFYEYGEK